MTAIRWALAAVAVVAALAFTSAVPKTVSSLNTKEYLGTWYQMYASPSVEYTFEFGGVCITAHYTDNGQNITVLNQQRMYSVDGTIKSIHGWAYVPNTQEPGQLKVVFPSVPGAAGDYWVLALGPVVDGQYQWSIVSDPLQLSLFVLARDVDVFNAKYNDEIVQLLQSLGFTGFLNKPVATVQANCTYPAFL